LGYIRCITDFLLKIINIYNLLKIANKASTLSRILGRGTTVLRIFLHAIHSNLYYGLYPPPASESGLKLVCNVKIVYRNLMSENSQDNARNLNEIVCS
jgi:hypothetical protein